MIQAEYISGVDEAGRGAVLGPLLIAICTISSEQVDYFKNIGVTDSKLIPPKKRDELYEIITKEAKEYKIIAVPAQELNITMKKYSLNEIEAQKTTEMIIDLKTIPSKIYVDSPDVAESKYKTRILNNLRLKKYTKKINIISEHKADYKYISVGCASILAKVTRDRMITSLIGNLSGYPSDPKTIEYLKKYIVKNKKIPEFARTEWSTIDKIMKELYQKKIGWFCD